MITLHPILFGKSTFTYSCTCQVEVVDSAVLKFHSQNYRSYYYLEVYARVPRLDSNHVFIDKLQPLYFVKCGFWRGLHCEGWKLCRARFCEVPPKPKKKNFFDSPNGIWQALKTSILSTDLPHSNTNNLFFSFFPLSRSIYMYRSSMQLPRLEVHEGRHWLPFPQ